MAYIVATTKNNMVVTIKGGSDAAGTQLILNPLDPGSKPPSTIYFTMLVGERDID